MERKNSSKQINNTEASASVEQKETFTLPNFQKVQNQYDNIGAYNQL